MKIGSLITTCNRPAALERTLQHVISLHDRVLIVDDAAQGGIEIDLKGNQQPHCTLIHTRARRGLAAALNIGLSWWMADPEITHISTFQDDVEVDPRLHEVALFVLEKYPKQHYLFTGHDAREHPIITNRWLDCGGGKRMKVAVKPSCRATQMFASVESWKRVMPIRSRGLGLPGFVTGTPDDGSGDGGRGRGSDIDWWIVRDSPNRLGVLCVPGLVRTPLWKSEDSTWGNTQRTGPDSALSRAVIHEWMQARGY